MRIGRVSAKSLSRSVLANRCFASASTTTVTTTSSVPTSVQLQPKLENDIAVTKTVIKKGELNVVESLMKYGGSTIAFPLAPFWFFQVKNNHRAVLTVFGKYSETLAEGLHWRSPIGMSYREVFIGNVSKELKKSAIVDSNGNPVIVSGTVNYHVAEPEKFVVNVNADSHYLNNQAEIVLKKVASEYPYESKTGDSLTKEGRLISERMAKELQNLVEIAGIKVDNFYLTDINYAPEIAQNMLVRQRAIACIEAKDAIARASAGIVQQTIFDVENRCNIKLSDQKKGEIIDHLLVVMMSESGVQPTVSLSNTHQ